jgi:hypothetical protein
MPVKPAFFVLLSTQFLYNCKNGEECMKNIPTSNILKDDFGWEVPYETVPLPSQGVLYSPDSILYLKESLDIKAMTAKEEDILSSPALIKKGNAISELLKSCIVDKGIDVNELLLGDRNALMVSIRITGYGHDYKASMRCKHCNHINDTTLSLAELPLNFLKLEPITKGKNEFEFHLPVTKKVVTFKFTTGKDEKDLNETREKMDKYFTSDIKNNVTNMLERAIVSIDGIRDKNKIKHFVQYMPAYDSKALRNYILENQPGIDMSHNLACKNCNSESEVSIPITSEFFWPST